MTASKLIVIALSLNAALLVFAAVICETGQPSGGDPLQTTGYISLANGGDGGRFASMPLTENDIQSAGERSGPGFIRRDVLVAASGQTAMPSDGMQSGGRAAPGYSTGVQANDYHPATSQLPGAETEGVLPSQHGGPAVASSAQAAKVPLVFSDTTGLDLNPFQQQQISNMQQDFVDAVGDSNSPGYARRWQSAQWQIDEEFKQQFGTQAFIQQQLVEASQGKQLTMP